MLLSIDSKALHSSYGNLPSLEFNDSLDNVGDHYYGETTIEPITAQIRRANTTVWFQINKALALCQ